METSSASHSLLELTNLICTISLTVLRHKILQQESTVIALEPEITNVASCKGLY